MEYWLNHDDLLVEVDEEFRRFAIDNGAPELASDSILGRPMAAFCTDESTIEIWTRLLARARAGAAVAVVIRCDSPEKRRLVDLRLEAHEDRRSRSGPWQLRSRP